MVTEVAKRLINVDEYHKMAEVDILKPSDRVELIHGEIIEMSPIGSRHASIVNRLAKILNQLFMEELIVGIQAPINIDSGNEPEPDISILKSKQDFYASAHPKPFDVLAVIEVSDSSLSYDRDVKLPLYASVDIPNYWIVDIEANQIIVYTKPKGPDYMERVIYQLDDQIELRGKTIGVKDVITQPETN